jgi:ribonuclease P protein component
MNQFPKVNRLSKQDEFRRSLDFGEKVIDRFIVMKGIATPNAFPRLGIIVTRKFGGAVVRNRFKRQIRECFRTIKEDYRGFDVVVIGRKDACTADFGEIRATLVRSMKRLEKKLQKSSLATTG